MTTILPAVHGRINDLDSHLQVPISRWGEVFGEATARFGERFAGIPLFGPLGQRLDRRIPEERYHATRLRESRDHRGGRAAGL